MLNKLQGEIKKLMPEMIESISEMIKIPSVEDPKTQSPEKPQGEGCYRALMKMEEISRELGFFLKKELMKIMTMILRSLFKTHSIGIYFRKTS